jgi:hypothetical protein
MFSHQPKYIQVAKEESTGLSLILRFSFKKLRNLVAIDDSVDSEIARYQAMSWWQLLQDREIG